MQASRIQIKIAVVSSFVHIVSTAKLSDPAFRNKNRYGQLCGQSSPLRPKALGHNGYFFYFCTELFRNIDYGKTHYCYKGKNPFRRPGSGAVKRPVCTYGPWPLRDIGLRSKRHLFLFRLHSRSSGCSQKRGSGAIQEKGRRRVFPQSFLQGFRNGPPVVCHGRTSALFACHGSGYAG